MKFYFHRTLQLIDCSSIPYKQPRFYSKETHVLCAGLPYSPSNFQSQVCCNSAEMPVGFFSVPGWVAGAIVTRMGEDARDQ